MNESIGLVAIDLDGTLLRPNRTLSRTVIDAVAAAATLVPVVIATARPPRSARATHAALGLSTPAVCYNGALTWDFSRDAAVTHVPLRTEDCVAMIGAARAFLPSVIVNVESLDRWYTDRVSDRFITETGRLFAPTAVAPLATFANLGATKLMFQAEAAEIGLLRATLESDFPTITFIRTDPDLLQAINAGASKWQGVLAVAADNGIDASQILAIGDNENDVEMIRSAGVGVAMANGTPAARAAADWIAPSNVDDGVAAALGRFVLARRPRTVEAEAPR